MNGTELLRLVDTIHRDKNIGKEIIFEGIEAAYASAMRKRYGDEAEIVVRISRTDGSIAATVNGEVAEVPPGRIMAQTAKQVIIQKIREAERDALFDEYHAQIGQLISGTVSRVEGGVAAISLGNVEAILPRSEMIPGESHEANERVRATIFEVKKQGTRVRIILSRIRTDLVRRLFEQEIPEIADGVIEIRAMARKQGYRTKVAVSSTDQRVDCVGACVGVRGNRIKNIVDELSNERIDIVRWNDDMEELIPNALQPAEVEQVILCPMIGKAIVLVREDQLSLAIGRHGHNVNLASRLCGWDIEIMTREELDESIERAIGGFSTIPGVDENLSEKLVGEGFLSYDELSVIEPDNLMEMGSMSREQAEAIALVAEEKAAEADAAAAEQRRRQREQDRIAAATAAEPAPTGADEAAVSPGEAGAAGEAGTAAVGSEEVSSESQGEEAVAESESPNGAEDASTIVEGSGEGASEES